MADVPQEAPHKVAAGGLKSLKKLPPWAWVAVVGGGLLLIMIMRRNAAKKAADSTTAPATDPNASVDPNAGYTDPYANSGAYGTQGYVDPTGGLGGFISSGAGSSGVLPSPVGPTTPTDTTGSGTTAPAAAAGTTITVGGGQGGQGGMGGTGIITGGGAPSRPTSTIHQPPCPTGYHRVNGNCVPFGPGGPKFNHHCPNGYDWNYTTGKCEKMKSKSR